MASVVDAPLIRPNFLTTQKDIDEAVRGGQLVRRIMGAPALRAITVQETKPGKLVQSEAEMLAPSRACLQFLAPLAQTYIDSGG